MSILLSQKMELTKQSRSLQNFIAVKAILSVKCGFSWKSVVDQQMVVRIILKSFFNKSKLPLLLDTQRFCGFSCHRQLQATGAYFHPPKIVSQFFPQQGAETTASTQSLHEFDRPVSIDMAQQILKPQALICSGYNAFTIGVSSAILSNLFDIATTVVTSFLM